MVEAAATSKEFGIKNFTSLLDNNLQAIIIKMKGQLKSKTDIGGGCYESVSDSENSTNYRRS